MRMDTLALTPELVQMPGRWRQIATIRFGVQAWASFPVCQPSRPERIGSENRRLGKSEFHQSAVDAS